MCCIHCLKVGSQLWWASIKSHACLRSDQWKFCAILWCHMRLTNCDKKRFTFLSCDCAVAHGPHAWHSSSPYAVWWPEARQGQRQWRTHACMDDRRVPGSCSCSGGVFGGPSNPNLHPPDRSISLVRHPMIDKALLAVFWRNPMLACLVGYASAT
jgi:hypothetical protein